MGTRRQAREIALQALYLSDITQLEHLDAMRRVLKDTKLEKDGIAFANRLVTGALENREKLDDLIIKYAKNWDIKRMAVLDRNILRLGAYELLFEIQTPVSVIIDEAVELAKMYSTDDSGKFVNGILDRIQTERQVQNHG